MPITLVRLGALLLATLLTAGCSSLQYRPQALEAWVTGLQIIDPDVREQRYRLYLRLQNPNTTPLSLLGLRLELSLGGHDLDPAQSTRAFALPAFGRAELSLDLTARDPQLLTWVEALERQEPGILTYRLAGQAITASDIPAVDFSGDGELGRPLEPGNTRSAPLPD